MAKSRSPQATRNKSGGGFLLGVFIGLLIGLAIASFSAAPIPDRPSPMLLVPVSTPPASGLQTTSPMPSFLAVGRTFASMWRSSKLYGGCSTLGG